jgi:MFS family permease
MQTSALTEAAMQRRIAVFTIGMAFLAWMAIKLPMPALPFLGHYFHTSQQVFKVSVTLNLISFSVSQLFWGPLSDIKGRRAITLYAFSLAIVGTILAMLAVNIEMYLAGRILEGFAVGCAAPVGRAMMADRLDKVSMARLYAWYAIAALRLYPVDQPSLLAPQALHNQPQNPQEYDQLNTSQC